MGDSQPRDGVEGKRQSLRDCDDSENISYDTYQQDPAPSFNPRGTAGFLADDLTL